MTAKRKVKLEVNLLRRDSLTVADPLLVGIEEAARLLGISVRTLQSPRWSEIPRIVRGGRTLFSVEVLRNWIDCQLSMGNRTCCDQSGSGDKFFALAVSSFGCWEI